jgi:hypothetical protein
MLAHRTEIRFDKGLLVAEAVRLSSFSMSSLDLIDNTAITQ